MQQFLFGRLDPSDLGGLGILFDSTTGPLTWEEANIYCQEFGNGRLIEIMTEEQLDFLQMELNALDDHEESHYWWTGGTDVGRDGKWIWIESLRDVADFVFHAGEPNDGSSLICLYLEFNWGYEAGDLICDYTTNIYPICQQLIFE